ncbi:MAG: FecR family protein [Candidatus Pedobacter colombiensis]|uniref:FecR family protein n=1 Tax=Candidatus Pedobacter colombiensis TaxID=3121371 RepID=A0AAJ5WBX8_9SPHI|nr:FecR family protein [Pedobacter sp.]WEK21757.1 MAG: FecR family protein [Pedobacter sp.]
MMQHNDAESLLKKYQSGSCSPAEQKMVEDWLTYGEARTFDLTEKELDEDLKDLQIRVSRIPVVKRISLWPRIAVAAAVLLTLGIGFYFYPKFKNDNDITVIAAHKDIPCGKNKAILTLANGAKISITDALNGELVKESGVVISKTSNGQLVYQVTDKTAVSGTKEAYNTIETPKGGQHQVILPDGTRVWLNAASSIKFSERFTNIPERRVELKGEAYFEVSKDKKHPFIVRTDKQEIEVLGTHFNINSYADEQKSVTTLLEGSVKTAPVGYENGKAGVVLHQLSTIISPGEQASSTHGDIKVAIADIEQVMDWKNGDFMFKKESLAGIMRKVSRWYDVTVEYDKEVDQNQTYSGFVSRSKNISEVLKIMQSAGRLKFDITGKKVIVMK